MGMARGAGTSLFKVTSAVTFSCKIRSVFTQSFQQTERQTDKCRALHNLLGRGKYPKRSIIKEPQSAPGTGKTSFAPSSPHKSTLIIGALEAVKEEKETQGQLYNLI